MGFPSIPPLHKSRKTLSFSWVLPESVAMGPGLWKLNLAILEEDEFVTRITDFWFFWQGCQSGFSTLMQWWDASHTKKHHEKPSQPKQNDHQTHTSDLHSRTGRYKTATPQEWTEPKEPTHKNQNEKTTTGDQQTKQHVSAADTLPNERDGTATGGTPVAGVYPSIHLH